MAAISNFLGAGFSVGGKILHELWTGKKLSLENLIVVGWDAYVHVPKENRSKLDNKVEECVFVGYKYVMKGYKIWSP